MTYCNNAGWPVTAAEATSVCESVSGPAPTSQCDERSEATRRGPQNSIAEAEAFIHHAIGSLVAPLMLNFASANAEPGVRVGVRFGAGAYASVSSENVEVICAPEIVGDSGVLFLVVVDGEIDFGYCVGWPSGPRQKTGLGPWLTKTLEAIRVKLITRRFPHHQEQPEHGSTLSPSPSVAEEHK